MSEEHDESKHVFKALLLMDEERVPNFPNVPLKDVGSLRSHIIALPHGFSESATGHK